MLYLYQDKGKAINKANIKTKKYIPSTKHHQTIKRKAGNNMKEKRIKELEKN